MPNRYSGSRLQRNAPGAALVTRQLGLPVWWVWISLGVPGGNGFWRFMPATCRPGRSAWHSCCSILSSPTPRASGCRSISANSRTTEALLSLMQATRRAPLCSISAPALAGWCGGSTAMAESPAASKTAPDGLAGVGASGSKACRPSRADSCAGTSCLAECFRRDHRSYLLLSPEPIRLHSTTRRGAR